MCLKGHSEVLLCVNHREKSTSIDLAGIGNVRCKEIAVLVLNYAVIKISSDRFSINFTHTPTDNSGIMVQGLERFVSDLPLVVGKVDGI